MYVSCVQTFVWQQALVEKWVQRDPSVVWFDNKLQYYRKIVEDVQSLATTRDQECIRLSTSQLASSVISNAQQWMEVLGKILQDSTRENLHRLRDMLDVSEFFKIMEKH